MSEIENNKIIARRWFELISEHKVEDICAMTAPTWKLHGGPPQLAQGPDGVRQLFSSFGNIKQQWTIEDVIAQSDKVVVRATNTCTQESFFWHSGARKTTDFYSHIYSSDCGWKNRRNLAKC
ncbi:nuclear transport factor 2 family protein [Nostoc sp. FACHB-152]|uniref:ester cyclase n=1 Tax=unclassified Nostoc TaxID=2593658 RepID=UPI0016863DB2|nr:MULTISPECIES: nuclear transport factor 2 family protein [unclassified Nostoc]MBD2451117.1 nuclear transport factor 2 family protein [Nostoc sp. FACHB-152]MBD2473276.1 nuclear transport factor 2 family protein [Nostoc sp. FACHB-145]